MKMRAGITILVLLVSLLAINVNGDRDRGHDERGNYHENQGHDNNNNNGHSHDPKNAKGLQKDFYHESCPQFEQIVQNITWRKVNDDHTMAPKLLRLHYHDCFVRGCDASILLDPVNGDNSTEKNAGPNKSIAGYEVIDEIKAKLEDVCPGVVSCADIVAMSARDAVSFQTEPLWPVLTGRRDGRVSLATEASRDLPSGGSNFTTLLNLFARFKLSKNDLVALSGAHTIGVAHCAVFQRRVFNFTGKGDTDPDLSPEYAQSLKAQCGSPTVAVGLDRKTPQTFDSNYFVGLTQKEGLLTSDSALLKDPQAKALVLKFQSFWAFKKAFARSMVNMGNIGVLTGQNGDIRKNCRVVN